MYQLGGKLNKLVTLYEKKIYCNFFELSQLHVYHQTLTSVTHKQSFYRSNRPPE